MSMKCPACGKNHWERCTDRSVALWKRMIAGEYSDGDRYLLDSRKDVPAREFAREVNQLERKCAALEAENKRLKDLCQRWNVTAGHFAAGSEFINDPERVLEVLKAREEGRRRLSEVKERKHAEEVSRLRSQLELVRERLGGAPEINPCNYDHDEVVELSSACILAYFLAGGKPTNEEVPEYKQAQAELLDAWREQHDNLVACFQTEQKNLGAKIDTLELQLTVSEKGRICAIEDKQGFIEDWKRLTAENERLREALQQVEWSGLVLDNDGRHIDLCPLCDQVKEKGHSPDCLVGAALGRQV